MDKKYYKRTRRTWRRHKSGNTHPFTQNDTKKNTKLENARPWWNTWFLVQEIPLHSRQTSTRNEQMLTRYQSGWPKKRPYWFRRTQAKELLETITDRHLPNNDVENTNKTNKRKYLLRVTSQGLFPDEQKRCCKGSGGTAKLLYLDQHTLNESKTRRKNLAIAWIDYKRHMTWFYKTAY